MSYIKDIKDKFNIDENDIYSFIVVSSNLDDPFDGWSGVALKQVFGDKNYQIYFGDFPDELAAFENVPEFVINRRLSKTSAADMLRSWISENIKDDIIAVSSNAKSWLLPFVKDFKALTNMNINLWDLRDMYSLHKDEVGINNFGPVFSAFSNAKALPKTFGLRSIADSMSIFNIPKLGIQPEYRASLTAKIAEVILS